MRKKQAYEKRGVKFYIINYSKKLDHPFGNNS